MIKAEFTLEEDDRHVTTAWVQHVPRVGEVIWFNRRGDLIKEFGAASFTVTLIAHWISDAWSPNTHTGDPIHNVCVYVEPVDRAEDGNDAVG